MTEPDPYTAEAQLCDDDGTVRGGRPHHGGTDYPCTGHAHTGGQHVLCTSPAHRRGAATIGPNQLTVLQVSEQTENHVIGHWMDLLIADLPPGSKVMVIVGDIKVRTADTDMWVEDAARRFYDATCGPDCAWETVTPELRELHRTGIRAVLETLAIG